MFFTINFMTCIFEISSASASAKNVRQELKHIYNFDPRWARGCNNNPLWFQFVFSLFCLFSFIFFYISVFLFFFFSSRPAVPTLALLLFIFFPAFSLPRLTLRCAVTWNLICCLWKRTGVILDALISYLNLLAQPLHRQRESGYFTFSHFHNIIPT